LEIDNKFNSIYFNEELIKESEKLPDKVKDSLEKGRIIQKEWNEDKLISLINDCINIEKSIIDINIINENIQKGNCNKLISIDF
jgi:hypothetical protein